MAYVLGQALKRIRVGLRPVSSVGSDVRPPRGAQRSTCPAACALGCRRAPPHRCFSSYVHPVFAATVRSWPGADFAGVCAQRIVGGAGVCSHAIPAGGIASVRPAVPLFLLPWVARAEGCGLLLWRGAALRLGSGHSPWFRRRFASVCRRDPPFRCPSSNVRPAFSATASAWPFAGCAGVCA